MSFLAVSGQWKLRYANTSLCHPAIKLNGLVRSQRLYDRMWFFVTESLLAFTIFRDEFDIPFGVMFLFLLFVKSFHWLLSDRVEWVRRSPFMRDSILSLLKMNQMPFPGPPKLFHARIVTLFIVLYLTDTVMIIYAVESVQTKGVGAIVLFASEVCGVLLPSQ